MQKDYRIRRLKNKDAQDEFIQFRLFKVPFSYVFYLIFKMAKMKTINIPKVKDDVQIDENKTSGLKLYANQLEKVGDSGKYINMREVTKRFRLDPGNYIVIPSTYYEDHSCEFMLRVFTEEHIGSQ